jgi:hypothetical protein
MFPRNKIMSKIIFVALLIISFLSPSVTAKCKNDPPTKSELIELLGNPIECNTPKKSENMVCFEKFGVFIHAKINSSSIVEKVSMSGCEMKKGEKVVEFIVSKNKSGKLINTTIYSEECDSAKITGGSGKTTDEEYECMTIYYYQSYCPTNCKFYSISITWKK